MHIINSLEHRTRVEPLISNLIVTVSASSQSYLYLSCNSSISFDFEPNLVALRGRVGPENFFQEQCIDTAKMISKLSYSGLLGPLQKTVSIFNGCMAMTLKPKVNHPNGSGQKSEDRIKHAKFGQM